MKWTFKQCDIFDADDNHVATCTHMKENFLSAHENAAFIVRCVNSHEELLGRLHECVQLMVENVNYQEDKEFKLAVDSACDAIAKAEGK